MQIQVNTGNHIAGSEGLTRHVEGVVTDALGRFGQRITRVEVHLNDEHAAKPGDNDHRCQMEARLAGLQPVSASDQAATLKQALDGAAKKLQRALDATLGKLDAR